MHVAPLELRDLETALSEIIEFSNQLHTFSRLNSAAIQKLHQIACHSEWFTELAQTAGCLLYTQPWAESASRVKDLLNLVCQAGQNRDSASRTRSLLLESVSPAALGCTSEEVHSSIGIDDPATLMVAMASPVSYLENQVMLYSVLQVAIVYDSVMCIKSLLEEITYQFDEGGCDHQDVLHQLIIQSSRSRTFQTTGHSGLVEIFRELSPYQHHMLLAKDWRQRYPLHYAAQYGFYELCSQIMKHMEPAAVLEPDISGVTSLHLAVSSGHAKVVKLFLQFDTVRSMIAEETTGALLHMAIHAGFADVMKCLLTLGKGYNFQERHGWTPLYHAAAAGHAEEVETILAMIPSVALDLAETSRQWSPLIVASARGQIAIVRLLLQAGANVAVKDIRGWSAIEHAAYRAHMAIVDVLQQAEPVPVQETARLRSSMPSQCAKPPNNPRPTYFTDPIPSEEATSSSTTIFLNLGTFDLNSKSQIFQFEPSMKFGRSQPGSLSTEYLLEISGSPCEEQPYTIQLPFLGDLCEPTWIFHTPDHPDDMRLTFRLLCGRPGSGQLAAAGVAVLGAIRGWFPGGRQSLRRESRVALVAPDGRFAGSVTFSFVLCTPYRPPCTPPLRAQRLTMLRRPGDVEEGGEGEREKEKGGESRNKSGEERWEGREGMKRGEGDGESGRDRVEERMREQRKQEGEQAEGPTIPTTSMTWVAGHRGVGWNTTALGAGAGADADAEAGVGVPRRRLELGEHTLASLAAAPAHGADLVEFDVQVTRDGVPVIYHDWHVSETGLDVPVHATTLRQWMAVSDCLMGGGADADVGGTQRGRMGRRGRTRSLGEAPDHHGRALTERLRHTVEYARGHNKGNIRGDCIHDSFTTLRELFEKLPEAVSFDIEMSKYIYVHTRHQPTTQYGDTNPNLPAEYPMLWECEYWEMEPYWLEMNAYVDATLDVVFGHHGQGRSVLFSAFNPEVCMLLAAKQRAYPVVFLSDSNVGGAAGDARATSAQRAVRLAAHWGLAGVVLAAEPLVAAPALVGHVRADRGLFCGSYGAANDVPENAEVRVFSVCLVRV